MFLDGDIDHAIFNFDLTLKKDVAAQKVDFYAQS